VKNFDIDIGLQPNGEPIVLSGEDRTTHVQLAGVSRKGKSKCMEHMIRQDILNPDKPGVLLLDPHGRSYDDLVQWCAYMDIDKDRKIHLWNPSEDGSVFGFNPLQALSHVAASVRVDSVLDAIAKVFKEESLKTPQLSKYLRTTFYSLYVNNCTLAESLNLVLSHDPYNIRGYLTRDVGNPAIQGALDETETFSKRNRVEEFRSVVNRIVRILTNDVLRNSLGQTECAINFRECMDNGDIVLIKLADSGKLSRQTSDLLGTLIINEVLLATRGREATTESVHPHPFYVYIDECHRFLNDDIEEILDAAAKFGTYLTLSHQRMGQLQKAGDSVYSAVMAGAQTKIVFGLESGEDADALARTIFQSQIDLQEGVELTKRAVHTGEYRKESLHSYSDSESEGESYADTGAWSLSEYVPDEGDASGVTSGVSGSSMHSTQYNRTHSDSYQETLVPIFEEMYSERYNLTEQLFKAATKLAKQPRRHAYVSFPEGTATAMTTIDVDPPIGTPEMTARFTQAVLAHDPYVLPLADAQQVLVDREERLRISAKKLEKARHDGIDETDEPY